MTPTPKRLLVALLLVTAVTISLALIFGSLRSAPKGREPKYSNGLRQLEDGAMHIESSNDPNPVIEEPPSPAATQTSASLYPKSEAELTREKRLMIGEAMFSAANAYKDRVLKERKYIVPYEDILTQFRYFMDYITPEISHRYVEGTLFRYIFPGDWQEVYDDGFPAAWCHLLIALGLQLNAAQKQAITDLVWSIHRQGTAECRTLEEAVIDPNGEFGDESWNIAWEIETELYQKLYVEFISEITQILNEGQMARLREFLAVCQLTVPSGQ